MSDIRDQIENAILKNNEAARKENDQLYAHKIVQKIVFTFVGILTTAVLFGVANVVTKNIEFFFSKQVIAEEEARVDDVEAVQIIDEE